MEFKQFLQENEDQLAKINAELDQLSEDEIEEFGFVLYYELFNDEEAKEDNYIDFDRSDLDSMIKELGVNFYDEILSLLEEYEDEAEQDTTNEGVGKIMKASNKNKKKRKFMQNSKAALRKTAALRKRENRAKKGKKKRYYNANKKKIASYQKSRDDAIKKGTHVVKLRKKAG